MPTTHIHFSSSYSVIPTEGWNWQWINWTAAKSHALGVPETSENTRIFGLLRCQDPDTRVAHPLKLVMIQPAK